MSSPTLEELVAKLTVIERAVDKLQTQLREQILEIQDFLDSAKKPEKPSGLPKGRDPAGGKIVSTRSSSW